MGKNIVVLLLLLVSFTGFAQTSTVTGRLFSPQLRPVGVAQIDFIKDSVAYRTTTDGYGNFSAVLDYGKYAMYILVNGVNYSMGEEIVNTPTMALGDIQVGEAAVGDTTQADSDQDIPTLSLSDSELDDAGSDNISSSLGASRDVFYNYASFTFSVARFRIRGYENENTSTYINGIAVNDLEDGGTGWGQWGGLNTMFYNRENSVGLRPTTFAYGGVGGSVGYDVRASKQRKQFQVSYATTNRNYRHRLMASYATGLLKGGWAVAAAVSRRWAAEGYVPGTFYDGYSYFVSVEKLFGNNHSLSLTMFGAPVRDGKALAPLAETVEITGNHYYNSYWGYQNGKKRNAIIGNSHQPMMILNYDWKINNHESLTTAASFSFGKRSRSTVTFYNAAQARPDYYRYLPSYQQDSVIRDLMRAQWQKDVNTSQLDWNDMYEANYTSFDSVKNAYGETGTVYGKRARYFQTNNVEDERAFNINSTYNNELTEHIALTAALNYQFQRTEYYQEVMDLMGADYAVDVNQFAERDFPDSLLAAQFDINRVNRILHEGDKFGYNYFITTHKGGAWAQSVFKFNRVDFFVAGQVSSTAFWRNGMTRYGLNPAGSYGKSEAKIFVNGGAKAGVTYKIDGRNYLYLNGSYENRAPYPDDAFLSPRTRNQFVNDLKSENIFSGELGYNFRAPYLKVSANLYFTEFTNQTRVYRFFQDDLRSFINYSLTGMNARHWGAEIGIEGKLPRGFTVNAVGAFGRYTYTSRPTATITYDNDINYIANEKVYLKNFNVAPGPQLATSFGINYRAPQFWFASVNFNYFDWMWVNVNPARRTESAVDLVDKYSDNFSKIIDQERLKGQFTMDISVGYSWLLNNQFKKLKKRFFLVFNASVTNVTNNKNLAMSAYEQLRFDYYQKNVDKFPARYSYAYGATYFVSVAFRMQ